MDVTTSDRVVIKHLELLWEDLGDVQRKPEVLSEKLKGNSDETQKTHHAAGNVDVKTVRFQMRTRMFLTCGTEAMRTMFW